MTITPENSEKLLVFLLRLAGCTTFLAFFAAVLPGDWMAASHQRLGLGEFPATPLVDYLTRSVSVLYGLHGVLLLLVSRQVRRFRPIVIYMGMFNLVLGSALLAIDLHAALPWWWTGFEGPAIAAMGGLILWAVRAVPELP